MRRSRTSTLAGALWLCVLTATTIIVVTPLVWLSFACSFVWNAPRMVWFAWQDWRFQRTTWPLRRYTLRQALRVELAIWAEEAGLR